MRQAGAPEVFSPVPRGFSEAVEELDARCSREEQRAVVERVLVERLMLPPGADGAEASLAAMRGGEGCLGREGIPGNPDLSTSSREIRFERVCNAVEHIFQSCVRRRVSPRRLGDALRTFMDVGSSHDGGENLSAYIVRRWSEVAPVLLDGEHDRKRRANTRHQLLPRVVGVGSTVGFSVDSDGCLGEPMVRLQLRVRGGGGADGAHHGGSMKDEETLDLRLPHSVLREFLDTQCAELVSAVQAAKASN